MSKQFNRAERDAIYSVIHERPDMRHFSNDSIASEVFIRVHRWL